MHPVDHLDAPVMLKALQGRLPERIDLDATDRAIRLPLSRTLIAARERRPDASDENEVCIHPLGQFDFEFSRPRLVPVHGLSRRGVFCHRT